MNNYRDNQETPTGMRSSRFTQRDGEWFLQTREGIELGPFESHAEAAMCLNEYIEFVEGASSEEVEAFFSRHAA